MPFLDELTNTAKQVDALLDQLMPLDTAPAKRVIDAMRYASIGQGKRLRPVLLLLAAEVFGG